MLVPLGGQQPMAYVPSLGRGAEDGRADAPAVSTTNVRTVTVDPRRGGVSCAAKVSATTDGPLTVVLAGCGRTLSFAKA